jgi:hypothetical protein
LHLLLRGLNPRTLDASQRRDLAEHFDLKLAQQPPVR